MEYNFIKVQYEGSICTLTISVPKSLNALSSKVLGEMDSFLDTINPETRALIITGEGERVLWQVQIFQKCLHWLTHKV